MAATAVPLLGFLGIGTIGLVLLLIGFTTHLRLAVAPNDRHTQFGIANVADLVREVGVRLTCPTDVHEHSDNGGQIEGRGRPGRRHHGKGTVDVSDCLPWNIHKRTSRPTLKGEVHTGGETKTSAKAQHTLLKLRHSEKRRSCPSRPISDAGVNWYSQICVFALSRSAPHFTTQPRVQPLVALYVQVGNGRKGARPVKRQAHSIPSSPECARGEERLDCRETDVVRVWGSPWIWREPPENGMVGVRNE